MTFEPVTVSRPWPAVRVPLVCDSPHSGTTYPADFRSALPLQQLRQGEDTDIDALWSAAPEVGATLVAAHFPRSYIDPNRALEDLDPELLDGPWPTPLQPGDKSRLGYGLIWRKLDPHTLMYDRRLSVSEVQHRIARCWQPYRNALQQAIDEAVATFGGVWHLNLHSMPDSAYARMGLKAQRPLADFVLGDRDGTTCEPGLMEVVERNLRHFGHSVARNDPYKGAALLAQMGQPALNRHSLQIEIRRPLYMNEATRERNGGFELLRSQLTHTLREVAAYVQSRVTSNPAVSSPARR
jgi:N-formylglutamate deformylase